MRLLETSPFLNLLPFPTGGSGLSVISASAEATGPTEITFTLSTSYAYAGVEWGVNPDYTWSSFDASQSTSHTIIIDAADGVTVGTTYAWRPYVTNDPLDAPANRIYGIGGTVETDAGAVTLGTVFAAPAAVNNSTQTLSSVTVDAGSNRLLVALPTWTHGAAGRVVTGIVLDPTGVNKAFTQMTGALITAQNSDFIYMDADVWYIKEADLPAAGTYNIVVTGSNFIRMTTGVINYANVNQTTPIVISKNSATSNTASMTAGAITTTAADQVCGICVAGSTTAASVASANTQQWEINETNFNDGVYCGATASGTGANVNMTWNQTGSNTGFVAVAAKVQA